MVHIYIGQSPHLTPPILLITTFNYCYWNLCLALLVPGVFLKRKCVEYGFGLFQIFDGNVDGTSKKKHILPNLLEARIIRINVLSYVEKAALRLEILGCGQSTVKYGLSDNTRETKWPMTPVLSPWIIRHLSKNFEIYLTAYPIFLK